MSNLHLKFGRRGRGDLHWRRRPDGHPHLASDWSQAEDQGVDQCCCQGASTPETAVLALTSAEQRAE